MSGASRENRQNSLAPIGGVPIEFSTRSQRADAHRRARLAVQLGVPAHVLAAGRFQAAQQHVHRARLHSLIWSGCSAVRDAASHTARQDNGDCTSTPPRPPPLMGRQSSMPQPLPAPHSMPISEFPGASFKTSTADIASPLWEASTHTDTQHQQHPDKGKTQEQIFQEAIQRFQTSASEDSEMWMTKAKMLLNELSGVKIERHNLCLASSRPGINLTTHKACEEAAIRHEGDLRQQLHDLIMSKKPLQMATQLMELPRRASDIHHAHLRLQVMILISCLISVGMDEERGLMEIACMAADALLHSHGRMPISELDLRGMAAAMPAVLQAHVHVQAGGVQFTKEAGHESSSLISQYVPELTSIPMIHDIVRFVSCLDNARELPPELYMFTLDLVSHFHTQAVLESWQEADAPPRIAPAAGGNARPESLSSSAIAKQRLQQKLQQRRAIQQGPSPRRVEDLKRGFLEAFRARCKREAELSLQRCRNAHDDVRRAAVDNTARQPQRQGSRGAAGRSSEAAQEGCRATEGEGAANDEEAIKMRMQAMLHAVVLHQAFSGLPHLVECALDGSGGATVGAHCKLEAGLLSRDARSKLARALLEVELEGRRAHITCLGARSLHMALGTLTFLNSLRDYTRLPPLRSESPISHLWGHCRLQVGGCGTGKRLELGVRGPLALWLIVKPPVSLGPDAGSATATAAASSSAGTDPGLVFLSVVAGGQRLRHRMMEAIGRSGPETGLPQPAVVLSAAASPGGPRLHAEVLRCLDERGCAAVRCGSTTEVERAVATLAAVRRQLNAANRDMVLVPQLTDRRAGPGEGSGDNLAHGNTGNSPSGSRAGFLPEADANLLWDIGSIGTMLESIVWDGDLPPREGGSISPSLEGPSSKVLRTNEGWQLRLRRKLLHLMPGIVGGCIESLDEVYRDGGHPNGTTTRASNLEDWKWGGSAEGGNGLLRSQLVLVAVECERAGGGSAAAGAEPVPVVRSGSAGTQ